MASMAVILLPAVDWQLLARSQQSKILAIATTRVDSTILLKHDPQWHGSHGVD